MSGKLKWLSCALGEIAPAKSSGMPSSRTRVWNLSLEDVEPITGRILKKVLCSVSELGSTKCAFDERHVLYSKLRPYLNKVAVPDGTGVGTSELIPLLPDPGRLDREFLAFCLRTPSFLRFAVANMRGANLPRIAMNELWKYPITFPESVVEQRRIVGRIKECMERIEEIESLRAEAMKESDALAPSLYEAIESSGTWPTRTVGDLTLGSRNGRSISKNNSDPTGYVLSLSAVRDVVLDVSCKKPIQLPKDVAKQFSIQEGDVFVSRSNTRELVGLASVANGSPEKVIYPDLLIKLIADTNAIRPRFLAYALRTASSRKQIKARAVGTSQSMVKISAERLKDVQIRVPSLADQDELLIDLDACHRLAFMVASELAHNKSTSLRDAILHKAFAGEL